MHLVPLHRSMRKSVSSVELTVHVSTTLEDEVAVAVSAVGADGTVSTAGCVVAPAVLLYPEEPAR